jgi:conjugal transfer/entry exclusion protein
MEDNFKTVERTTRESLSFIQQLQNQIGVCREGLSNINLPIFFKVETLESLLWAKLKEDKDYNESVKKIDEWFIKKTKGLKDYGEDEMKKVACSRKKAREKFKEIMIFIDKKGYMELREHE